MENTFYDIVNKLWNAEEGRSSLEHFFETFECGVWEWNLQTNALWFTPYCEKMLGYSGNELPRTLESVRELIHPDDLEKTRESVRAVLNCETPSGSHQFRFRHRNGGYVWVAERFARSNLDADGNATCISGILHNITDIKNAELDAEAYGQVMLDSTPLICSIWDENGNMLDCNMEALKRFGINSKKEYIGHFLDLSAPVQQGGIPSGKLAIEYISKAVETGYQQFLWDYRTAAGDPLPVETTLICIPWKDGHRILAYSRDLREINAEKKKAREAEVYLQLMLDSTPMVCAIWSEDIELIDCNMEVVRLFGLKDKSDYLDHFHNLNPVFQPDGTRSPDKAEAMLRKAFETGYQRFDWEYLVRDTGERIPADVTLIRVPYQNGYRVLAYSQDMREINEASIKVARYTNLLQTVNMVAENLMTSGNKDFHRTITEQIRTLVEALGANGCRIMEVLNDEGKTFFSQTHGWIGQRDFEDRVKRELVRADSVPFIAEAMKAGKTINSSIENLPEMERAYFDTLHFKSVLIIPVIMHDGLWGMITFENYINEELFPPIYEQALKSCGILIASSIIRNKMDNSLISARDDLSLRGSLLEAVNYVAKLLMDTSDTELTRTVQQCLEILGRSVGANRVSIWRNFEDEDGVLCAKRLPCWVDGLSFEESAKEIVINMPSYIPEWDKGVAERKDINLPIRYMNDTLRNFVTWQKGKSLLLVHIEIDGEFWGFVGFGHSDEMHSFSETEIGILRSGGMMIAEAIVRNEVNEQLIVATKEALASVKAKNEFLARMSHEIRTPLNAVIGMTTVAQGSDEMSKMRECLDIVATSSKRLLGIINDVLDMSNIDLGKLNISARDFDFENMLKYAIEALRAKSDVKHQQLIVDFEKPFDKMVYSDEHRISQIISNLMSNAIKFTQENGTITLKIHEEPRDENTSELSIQVIDNGIGIERDFIPHIFDPFEQADGSMTRMYGGSGLGLPICQTIVNMLDGDISVESEPGIGSCFTVRFPIVWGAPCAKFSYDNAARGDVRILVVDDMRDVLSYLHNILDGFSFLCDTAASAGEALEKTAEAWEQGRPYDVVFLDWFLHDCRGDDVARRILEQTDNPPNIVLMSVADWEAIAEHAEKAGIKYFMQKPLMPSAIFDMLMTIIGVQKTTAAKSERDTSVAADTDWTGRTLLLVEDIEINRLIAMELLSDTGVRIECAENGQEALQMFSEAPEKYDLILMDLQMPVMGGYDATISIRTSNLPRSRTIPIYAMTAHTFAADIEACLEAGMNGHIAKPIDYAMLFDTMTKAFS